MLPNQKRRVITIRKKLKTMTKSLLQYVHEKEVLIIENLKLKQENTELKKQLTELKKNLINKPTKAK